MSVDIEQVKAANPIEDVIEQTTPLQKRGGRFIRGEEHDSLVVDIKKQSYYWNSRGESGDVLSWVMNREGCDFKEAVERLSRRANLPLPTWGKDSAKAVLGRMQSDTWTVAVDYWHRALLRNDAALNYCYSRGWTDETIKAHRLGYCDGDTRSLRDEFSSRGVLTGSNAARAALQMPENMLVYPVMRAGRAIYFSGRSAAADEKRHWNPPRDLAGDRVPFFNDEYTHRAEVVVVVEGQADAITLAQWGIPAVALSGVAAGTTEAGRSLVKQLKNHQTVILGLDADQVVTVHRLAEALGPLTRVVRWPAKDPNDWLREGATAEDARALLDASEPYVLIAVREAGAIHGLEREAMVKEAMILVASMPEFSIAHYRNELCDALGVKVREFNNLLKAAQNEIELRAVAEEKDDDPREVVATPGGLIGEYLAEMLVIPPANENAGHVAGWSTKFAVRDEKGNISERTHLDVEGVRYVPISPNSRILTERVVQFASAVGEKKSLLELVKTIRKLIHKYVDVDPFYELLATYYIIFTWMYDSFNTLPYLRMLGDAGTGKSRFLQVVGAMCFRPIISTGAATVSPIFRIIDKYRGTLIFDEGDVRASDEANEMIKILNTGYQKMQGIVLRSGDKNTNFEPEVYVVYGPKIIGTRRRFSDWALESRCLTHEMGGPTTRSDIPVDVPNDFWRVEATEIRNALLRYRLEYWKPEVALDYSEADVSVEPRLNQVTVALQTLIDDPELRDGLRDFIREYNRQLIAERGMTLTSKVLEALVTVYYIDVMMYGVSLKFGPLVKRVAIATNAILDWENASGEADEEEDAKMRGGKKKVSPKLIGSIVRRDLHLGTEQNTDRQKLARVLWDDDRVHALRKRYGLADDNWIEQRIEVVKPMLPEPEHAGSIQNELV